MDDKRRDNLRVQYLKLTREYRRAIAEYDCGSELAEHLSPTLARLGRKIREIEAEVWQAIQDENKVTTKVTIIEDDSKAEHHSCPNCGPDGCGCGAG